MLRQRVQDWVEWEGVLKLNDLTDTNAQTLFQLASPLPDIYRQNINNYGYHLRKGARLLFPGIKPELIKLAFAVPAGSQLR